MDWGLIQMNTFSWIHDCNIKPRVSVAQLGNAITKLGNLWHVSIVLSVSFSHVFSEVRMRLQPRPWSTEKHLPCLSCHTPSQP